jgi:hypothetical protein
MRKFQSFFKHIPECLTYIHINVNFEFFSFTYWFGFISSAVCNQFSSASLSFQIFMGKNIKILTARFLYITTMKWFQLRIFCNTVGKPDGKNH